MTRRRIAMISTPWYPVPPVGYGGIELVIDLLMRELRRRDIDVVLYGAEGSAHGAIELAPSSWAHELGRPLQTTREVTYLSKVVARVRRRGADIVHDHTGGLSALIAGLLDVPAVHTVHGHLSEPNRTLYREVGNRLGLIAISDAQRASAPELNWVGRVHNAVDVDALTVGTRDDKQGYLLCLARISPQKGQHVAIEVARRTGRRLVLAGKVGSDSADQPYFDEVVAPYVDGDRIVYLNNISGSQKAKVLSQADALLAPSQWDEPFGLAMAEAMVSGTPVLTFPRGAASELIDQGITGLLCRDADAMVEALDTLSEIDPERCARIGRQRYSPATMADGYLAQYEAVLEGPMTAAQVQMAHA